MWDDIDTDQQAARTRQQLRFQPTPAPREAGTFENFAPTAGNYFMRSLAEVGRSASMAASAFPVVVDAAAGTSLSDRYFRWHDETFNNAVDYWTPSASEAGVAGQVVGQVAGGVLQFMMNPAVPIANAQLSTSEDLVRQGVDPGAALLAGDIAGISTALGIRLPAAFGKTLSTQVATGAAGNLAVSVPEAFAKQQVLAAAGAPDQVQQQFDPFDVKARAIDALLGAAFGAKAHWDSRVSPSQRDAMAASAQALHLETVASPGHPATQADLDLGVTGVRAAIDQMLRGEPVQVDETVRTVFDSPAKTAMRSELEGVVLENMPDMKPAIETPKMIEANVPVPKEGEAPDPQAARTQSVLAQYPGLRMAEEVDGKVNAMPAADYIARAEAEVKDAETYSESLMKTAASCLLGSL